MSTFATKISSLGSTLISAAIVGGGVFIGYELYQCYQKKGDLSPVSLIACATGDVANTIQREGDRLQCAMGGGSVPSFPFSPLAWAPKAFGAIKDTFAGKGFAKSVQNNGMMINCGK